MSCGLAIRRCQVRMKRRRWMDTLQAGTSEVPSLRFSAAQGRWLMAVDDDGCCCSGWRLAVVVVVVVVAVAVVVVVDGG